MESLTTSELPLGSLDTSGMFLKYDKRDISIRELFVASTSYT